MPISKIREFKKDKRAILNQILEVFYCYFHFLLCFLFSLALNLVITDTLKYMVGRLRPYFFSVCLPNYSLVASNVTYITQNICTGDLKKIHEARLSFPSGHSSFSTLTMVFSALYLEDFKLIFSSFLIPLFQLIFIITGLFVSASRYVDHHHHFEDVICDQNILF